MKIKVKKIHPDAIIPQYQTEGAACFDLHAADVPGTTMPTNGSPVTVGTGLAFEIPPGFVMLVFSRSGHGFNSNTRLANCVGVIDSDYRGEVRIKLTRDFGPGSPVLVNDGDRIAQAMIVPLPRVAFEEVLELSDTARGAGGFGSTGHNQPTAAAVNALREETGAGVMQCRNALKHCDGDVDRAVQYIRTGGRG